MTLMTKKPALPHPTAKLFAVGFGVLLTALPASASDPLYYATPKNSSEVIGNFSTDNFKADIDLFQSSRHLLLNKIAFNEKTSQFHTESYPVKFNFEGDGWSASLAAPAHVEMQGGVDDDGDYNIIIRANVDFKTKESGQPVNRTGIATLRMNDSDGWFWSSQHVSLQIVDAYNQNLALYDDQMNYTMVARPDDAEIKAAYVEDGEFEEKSFAKNDDGSWADYKVPVYDYIVYNGKPTPIANPN